MKKAVGVIVALLASSPAVAQPAAPPVRVFHANGTFGTATAFVFDASGFTSLFIGVSRDAEAGPGTFLSYSATTSDPAGNGFTNTFGFGDIPSSALDDSALVRLRLSVDTSQVLGFQVTTCTVTFSPTFTSTCVPGALGLVQAEWRQDGFFTQHSVGSTETCFFQFCHRNIGNSFSTSASASGSFLGFAFTNGAGQFGTLRDTEISIVPNR